MADRINPVIDECYVALNSGSRSALDEALAQARQPLELRINQLKDVLANLVSACDQFGVDVDGEKKLIRATQAADEALATDDPHKWFTRAQVWARREGAAEAQQRIIEMANTMRRSGLGLADLVADLCNEQAAALRERKE